MGKSRVAPPHSCNILHLGENTRQLWHFSLAGNQASLSAEHHTPPGTPLPSGLVAKTWKSLWHRRLNVAWLAADQVFLRVVHLPACAPDELPSMVELQLEKLSPIPLNQAVWSFDQVASPATVPAPPAPEPQSDASATPAPANNLQTVVVIIVARQLVENYLGELENQGYQPDRLEFPVLHQLLSLPVEDDRICVIPGLQEGKNTTLVAWWTGHTLQHLALLYLPADESWMTCLSEQLNQMAWSGEMEGWLKSIPECHLIADPATAAVWEPVLQAWIERPIQLEPALLRPDMAALSARRLLRNESHANLLPVEFASRYRQQFTDRLWMRGLGALVMVYLAAVLVYFGFLEVLKYQHSRYQKELRALSADYQLTQQFKARSEVLQDRQELKYAALDCWKVAAELLPEELTLESLSFQKGKVMISGIVPADQVTKISEYNRAMGGAMVNGRKLFSKVNSPNSKASPASQNYTWNFTCEMPEIDVE